jgi:hypothetical protein
MVAPIGDVELDAPVLDVDAWTALAAKLPDKP